MELKKALQRALQRAHSRDILRVYLTARQKTDEMAPLWGQ
jgi:hypothetical protein